MNVAHRNARAARRARIHRKIRWFVHDPPAPAREQSAARREIARTKLG